MRTRTSPRYVISFVCYVVVMGMRKLRGGVVNVVAYIPNMVVNANAYIPVCHVMLCHVMPCYVVLCHGFMEIYGGGLPSPWYVHICNIVMLCMKSMVMYMWWLWACRICFVELFGIESAMGTASRPLSFLSPSLFVFKVRRGGDSLADILKGRYRPSARK
jgi:hypothetical protein